jgi:hypothetical protein
VRGDDVCAPLSPSELVSIEADSAGEGAVRVTGHAASAGPGLARITWRGHLNADEREDLLLHFVDDCGNWGECLSALYVSCGEGRYRAVLLPDYRLVLEVGPARDAASWRDLREVVRGASASDDSLHEIRWRFEPGGIVYRPVPGSERLVQRLP